MILPKADGHYSFTVMAGHSRPKDGVASLRLCPGHPRFLSRRQAKTWMPATSAGMTERKRCV